VAPAFNAEVRRGISSGRLWIVTAHVPDLFVECAKARYGPFSRSEKGHRNWCIAQIYVDYFINPTRDGYRGWDLEIAMREVSPSRLPSLLVPCPLCVQRMVITAIEPALLASGARSKDHEDVTHGCEQCGTTIVRTIPSLSCVA
jgi:hypothetical protein